MNFLFYVHKAVACVLLCGRGGLSGKSVGRFSDVANPLRVSTDLLDKSVCLLSRRVYLFNKKIYLFNKTVCLFSKTPGLLSESVSCRFALSSDVFSYRKATPNGGIMRLLRLLPTPVHFALFSANKLAAR